jgi:hypothetical protein
MATYVNNLRLKEITTGDEDGTWGTSTNTNLELITDGFSYGTKEIAADANETFTMPDATADATRSLYLKFTSAVDLTATREITLGPNTVSKTWIIENATTGGQIITIKQGSGATVNVPNGSKVMIVTDGAGAGAAVFNANPTEVGGTVTSVGGTGTVNGLTLTGTVTTSGNLTLGGTLANVDLTSQVTGTLPIANGGTGSTSTTYVDLTTNVTGTLPVANGGTGVTSSTGTGSVVLSTSPTFTTPNLGTPSAATLTNATGLPIVAGTTGTLSVARGGTGSTTASGALTNLGLTATAAEINTLDGITATTTELNYTDGVTSNIQTQLNAKQATITGGATSITSSNLTVSRALVSDGSGKVAVSAVTSTEVGYLDGVTSNIQTQLNAKGVGSVTSVGGTGTVQGLTLSGTVTSSGNLTLGGSLSDINLTSQVTGTLPVANGGTGVTSSTGTGSVVLSSAPTITSLALDGAYSEEVYALSGTALDPANGTLQTKTLAANTTFTESLTSGESMILMLGAGASYTVTWPTITWVTSAGNVAPTLTANDTLVFWKISTTLYGAYAGSYA